VNRGEQLPLRLFAPGRCGALACSPSGSYLLAAVEENITVWQLNTGPRSFDPHWLLAEL